LFYEGGWIAVDNKELATKLEEISEEIDMVKRRIIRILSKQNDSSIFDNESEGQWANNNERGFFSLD
jgi:flagellar basal body-associated protein FliL